MQTINAVHDLDNLRVDQNDPSTQFVFAEFTLKHLVAYGTCYDKTRQSPPNGLQLVLGEIHLGSDSMSEKMRPYFHQRSDTLVMKNLGYFQLQADPGIWSIQLASGRASNIYRIVDPGSTNSNTDVLGQEMVIRNFLGEMQQLRVQKRDGMESVPLLDDGSYNPVEGISHPIPLTFFNS